MLAADIDARGAQVAAAWLHREVQVSCDRAYPLGLARHFSGQVVAVYPHGVMVRRPSRYRDFFSFKDLYTGHVRFAGRFGLDLSIAWGQPLWDRVAG